MTIQAKIGTHPLGTYLIRNRRKPLAIGDVVSVWRKGDARYAAPMRCTVTNIDADFNIVFMDRR